MNIRTPAALGVYAECLKRETDLGPFQAILRLLAEAPAKTVSPWLAAYLDSHPKGPLWTAVLLTLMPMDWDRTLRWISGVLTDSETETSLKLNIIRRLGNRPHAGAESVLLAFLQQAPPMCLPELRWMAIRSLGWIGNSQETLGTLETQYRYCQQDDILRLALDSAVHQVTERLAVQDTLTKRSARPVTPVVMEPLSVPSVLNLS
jgi:hypothetical protein